MKRNLEQRKEFSLSDQKQHVWDPKSKTRIMEQFQYTKVWIKNQ